MDTTRLAAQTFAQSLMVNLRSVDGCIVPVLTELGYDSSNPYALTISFHREDSTVVWTFARDLLSSGLAEPTGDGDVHVWPSFDDNGSAVVVVELCTRDGDALVEVRTADAVAFVERSHAVVAAGKESVHLDVDGIITALRDAENA
jgi:hypothetical protein